MAAIATVPNYAPSIWVRLCHAIPRLDLTLQTRDSVFTPDSWEYQQVNLSPSLTLASPQPFPCFSLSETIFTSDSWWWAVGKLITWSDTQLFLSRSLFSLLCLHPLILSKLYHICNIVCEQSEMSFFLLSEIFTC